MKKSKKELEYEEAKRQYDVDREEKMSGNYIRAEVIVREDDPEVYAVVEGQGVDTIEKAMLLKVLMTLTENFGNENKEALFFALNMNPNTKKIKHIEE